MNRIISTIAVALTFILAQPVIANAAEIKVWTARAIATVLAEIGPSSSLRRDTISMYSVGCLQISCDAPMPAKHSMS